MPRKFRTEDVSLWKTDVSAGEEILLSGTIYTARDAAHKRLCALIEDGRELPFNIKNQVIFFADIVNICKLLF